MGFFHGIDDLQTGHLPLFNDNNVLFHPVSQDTALSPFTSIHHQNAQIFGDYSPSWDPNTVAANTSAALATGDALYDDQPHLSLTGLGSINDFPITTSTFEAEHCDKSRNELGPYSHSPNPLDSADSSTIAGNTPLPNFKFQL